MGYIFSEKDKPMLQMLQLGFNDVSYPNLIDYAKWVNFCKFSVARFMFGNDIDTYVFHINELVVKRDVTYEWCKLFYENIKDVIPHRDKSLDWELIVKQTQLTNFLYLITTSDDECWFVSYFEEEPEIIDEVVFINGSYNITWELELIKIFVNYE